MTAGKADILPGLVLFSHGSLLCGSGAALQFHAEQLRAVGRYAAVEPGYLNYSEPTVEEAIARCVAAGASTVVIVPFFLVAGKFVREDLPRRLEKAAAKFPQTRLIMARALEDSTLMQDAVEQATKTSADPAQWQQQAVDRARELCKLRNDCPLYGSEMCRGTGSQPVKPIIDHQPDIPSSLATNHSPLAVGHSQAVIIILHGSPRPEANEPAMRLADNTRDGGKLKHVALAFLECNQPTIPDAIATCAELGMEKVIAVPYFLHSGRHQVLDIPRLLIEAAGNYPGMTIEMSSPVGQSPLLTDALAQRADEAL